MKLNIFTIVLDGAPWIGAQFAELCRLRDIEWHWSIVEGVSLPKADTSWMGSQGAKVSSDGTNQFIQSLKFHPRITVNSRPQWNGKTEMINAGISAFKDNGILLHMDSDELWTTQQMMLLVNLFEMLPNANTVKVAMDYMLGPNVISTSLDGYGNKKDEWVRAWRYEVGQWMECHEPPIFNGNKGEICERDASEMLFGRILHMAWVTPSQVSAKQKIYRGGYDSAVDNWLRVQKNTQWPIKDLKEFLPWVGSNGSADLLFDS